MSATTREGLRSRLGANQQIRAHSAANDYNVRNKGQAVHLEIGFIGFCQEG